jgi:hypothetical protein
MEAIFVTDGELKRLETRSGPVVRQMGPWNSDGIFGNASVSIITVETRVDLPEAFGPELIERIVDAYRQFSLWRYPSMLMYSRNTS